MCRIENSFLYKGCYVGEVPQELGVGMPVIAPKDREKQAMETISKYHEACILGKIQKIEDNHNVEVWTEGKVKW